MALTVAIIGALEKEVAQVYETLEQRSQSDEAGLSVARGRLGSVCIVACTAGMGTVNAAAATQHLISAYGAGTVIFSGIAGGLNPALHIGDVVVGERLRYLDTDTALIAESAPGLEEFASTENLVTLAEEELLAQGYRVVDAAAQELPAGTINADETSHQTEAEQTTTAPVLDDQPRYLRGTIATGDRFVTGDAMRAAAIEATSADCVEMEGAAVAHIAAKNGAACLVLRAISDNCDEAYDALSQRQFDLDEYARSASALTLGIVRRLEAEER